jgi:hypothetical protein
MNTPENIDALINKYILKAATVKEFHQQKKEKFQMIMANKIESCGSAVAIYKKKWVRFSISVCKRHGTILVPHPRILKSFGFKQAEFSISGYIFSVCGTGTSYR